MGLLKGTKEAGVNQIVLDKEPVQLKNLIAGTAPTDAATVSQLTGGELDPTFDDVTAGSLTVTETTDTTSGSTGSINTAGGIGAAKAIFAGTSVTATTSVITDTVAEKTSAAGVTVDGLLIKDGGATANSQIAAFYPQAAQNNITAGTGGAIAVTNYLTTINTDAGGDTFTLANGTQIGQMKKILLVVGGGGDGVVTPATAFAGGTTATFNDAADFLIIQWSGTAWVVLENSGVTIA